MVTCAAEAKGLGLWGRLPTREATGPLAGCFVGRHLSMTEGLYGLLSIEIPLITSHRPTPKDSVLIGTLHTNSACGAAVTSLWRSLCCLWVLRRLV